MKYKFKTKPFKHQAEALEKACDQQYYAFFMEMGTGKTKVAIDNLAMLYLKNKVDAALIIAPKGVYDNWVTLEIPKHLPDEVPVKMMRWQPRLSKTYQKELEIFVKHRFDGLKIFVMNIEALSTSKGTKIAGVFLIQNEDNMIIIDESTTIKNRGASRTKNLMTLKGYSSYRRILTGSPITKSPMDLYSQCSFLSTRALNFSSYYAFQGRYAIIKQRAFGARSFQEIVGYRNLEELNQKLEQFSTRTLKEECLDLPDKLYTRRNITMSDEQNSVYNQMKKLALAQLDSGELSTTASILTQIMRLQQICCGFFQPDVGEIRQLPNNRLSELLDITDELQGKAIIWASFTHDIQQIARSLRDRFGPDSVALYYGDTPQEDRQKIVHKFQDMTSELRFFVGQPKTGGYGITLSAATTVIYYSNSYDLENRLQSEDRAHRIGQKKNVTYIDLVCPNTIDEKILEALKSKINLSQKVFGEEARIWLQ
jgi:SNF2 family DNA or RNA helicase